MKFIKVLPEGLIDRIAAGEVIENPASALKELIENSLDAGANNLEIGVINGGKDEISIVDDGEGIPKDQVEIAFQRHATSKIKSWDDLLKTLTMGFRGEALPSISSVSIMELSTCYEAEKIGTTIRFEGGKQVYLGPAPPRKGCAISVRNLFFNVPARRKFLKSDISERRKISDILRRYIISHPEVGFKISYDGKIASNLNPDQTLIERLQSVWGDAITKNLLKLNQAGTGPVTIRGFISNPETTRSNRGEIFFFVNNRPVLEKAMYGAIIASFSRSLPPGRYPYAAVFLDIDTGFVDINVHPAKTEVRFADESYVFSLLKKAFDMALDTPARLISTGMFPANSQIPREHFNDGRIKTIPAMFPIGNEIIDTRRENEIQMPVSDTETPISREFGQTQTPIFMQIYDTFILTRHNGELILVDQHTAHERVLYEKSLRALEQSGAPSQKLLFEQRLKFMPAEMESLKLHNDLFAKIGFEYREFAADEILISGVPADIPDIDPGKILKDTLYTFQENLTDGRKIKHALAAALACRAAIKAGQRLPEIYMRELLIQLFNCREPYRCPHGRPTFTTFSRDDLEKAFRRK